MTIMPLLSRFFFFNDTATTEIYTLSLHDALPISGGLWSFADRQYCACGVWRARYTRNCSRRSYRARFISALEQNRSTASVVLFDRAVLADLGVCRFPRCACNLAGSSDRGGVLCRAAVPHFQLPRTMVSRHCFSRRADGCAHSLPQNMASEAAVAGDGTSRKK